MYNCLVCEYNTKRLDTYKRHIISKKHIKTLSEQEKDNNDEENKIYICEKCSKDYDNKRCYDKHISSCIGIDALTCPRCMKSFTNKCNKSRHIKNISCKPVSIFEYLNKKYINEEIINKSFNNIANSSFENCNNTIINNVTNNIYVNDYGKERQDYITYEELLSILKCCNNNIIPKYIKLKHFNPKFPENHNIKWKNNTFFIKRNNEWTNVTGNTLSSKLYNDGGNEIYKNLTKFNKEIKRDVTPSMYEDILMKGDYTDLELQGHDKEIKSHIKDIVKSEQLVKSILYNIF